MARMRYTTPFDPSSNTTQRCVRTLTVPFCVEKKTAENFVVVLADTAFEKAFNANMMMMMMMMLCMRVEERNEGSCRQSVSLYRSVLCIDTTALR
jgi:hypothetical protein